ncbi:hypothetical protein PHAVU_008G198800 [Phaseolus vulgaris]|uniref:Non-specific lipid-transfer protein n=1 Tax=Phaseolus vulgaris TaxID=3885 RepID=V7BAH1_PHAVU|nr:hypothetical protein PHAVU_008G198800g [Phaseolus vulgaris]ESW13466.1 hypothetical protein PHAVU_008G198800g [Phaseolus vulgaris]
MKKPSKALTCEQTESLMIPCLNFLTKKTNSPTLLCCLGLSKLIASTPTKEEKCVACKCLKKGVSHIPNLDIHRANNLPKICKIGVDYPISKDFDCEKIIKSKS